MNTPFKSFSNENLFYLVPPELRNPKGLEKVLIENPQIKFVSLIGVDLGGNDTDEKIPVSSFLKNIEEFLSGGIQTDGSSVVLPKIATLNNGKVDFIADPSVNWFVDYNYEHLDPKSATPIGTLRIPSFLIHNGHKVDSRSVLAQTLNRAKEELNKLFLSYPHFLKGIGINADEIEEIIFTSATELEFWVRTPGIKVETEKLSTSQILQEQYWKRTKGAVRTALEDSLILLEKYGLNPEMGHKEVGGIKATVSGDGQFNDIMEQLEIDWKYAGALQAADNEILARIIIKEVFRLYGLEVVFMAKPIEGVAGSGEHTHLSIAAKLKNGLVKNLFAPADLKSDYMSVLGWGALMGILKNYETIGAFITASNDAFNRLKPGFEAPICIVASIGHDLNTPSRNRTVLAGLIRDLDNPLATRFEVRSPNPHTNTYLAIAALLHGAMDGIKYALSSGKSTLELEKEFSKQPGESAAYLEKGRCYRSEEDVFESFDAIERDEIFGKPPATVWETFQNFDRYPKKMEVLTKMDALTSKIIESYRQAMITLWITELRDRIIPENMAMVRSFVKRNDNQNGTDYDEAKWREIQQLRVELLQDRQKRLSLFSRIREAITLRDYQLVSDLQLEMAAKMDLLKAKYHEYTRNLLG
jgi:glutamine synthetase